MAAFTVWKFDGPNGADQAAEILKQCQRDGMVKIIDRGRDVAGRREEAGDARGPRGALAQQRLGVPRGASAPC